MATIYLQQNRSRQSIRGQAIVEFAIALPVLLLILFGIFEVARLVFVYAAVTNASRNAVRYASAVGIDDDGFNHYNNCAGIRNIAKQSAFLMNLPDGNIDIRYDEGPNDPTYTDGHGPDTTAEWNLLSQCSSSATVETGDRVIVRITAQYSPMVSLVPISPRTFVSSSSRTILGIIDLAP